MSEPSLLSYPCLQSILQYFEVNHRILLARKIPSIKYAEKAVPLNTRGSITLKSHSTRINRFKYSLQVIRYDPEERKIKEFGSTSYSKITCDLDGDGNPIPGPPLTPGDFDFGGEEKMEKFSDSLSLDSYVMENGKLAWKKKEYQYFLKFSVQEHGEKGIYEYMEYHQDFHIAVKYLNSKLFQSRPPITLGYLHVEPERYLRLPANLKFDKCYLEVNNIHTGLETLRPLLTSSSFPINTVLTNKITVADHEFLKGVKQLYIENKDQKEFPPLPYKEVRFDYGINDREVFKILMDWKSGKREIGTLCTFGLNIKREWTTKINFLMRLEGAELGQVPEIRSTSLPHCVIFSINDASEIIIYCTQEDMSENPEKAKKVSENLDHYDEYIFYSMEMRIEPKGFATRI